MTLPDWMTSIAVLWIVILVLALVIIVLVFLLVAMRVNEARVLTLIRDTEFLLKTYIRDTVRRSEQFQELADEVEGLHRLQDLEVELVELLDLAEGDTTVLAMGGPDLPEMDTEPESEEQ